MEIAIAEEVQSTVRPDTTRKGLTPRKWLLTGEQPDGFVFRVVRSEYQAGEDAFETPRHHHAFQQVRWAEEGALNYAPGQDVGEGDIAYFPRGAYYGPQRRDHGIGLTLQFGFGIEMLGGKNASGVYREGVEKLRERGRIEDGLYIDIHPDTGRERRRDPAEAVAEAVTGIPYTIPAEQYEAPILMHPQAFEYYEAIPGVELKNLGSFFDHPGPDADLRISVARFSGGGEYKLGGERSQVAWAKAGLKVDGQTFGTLTCVYSPRDEVLTIGGTDGAEVFVVEFPRLD